MTYHTAEPWHLEPDGIRGDEHRLIVGPGNELIADAYPDTADSFDLPKDYQANAALLVEAAAMYHALLDLHEWEAQGDAGGEAHQWANSRAIIHRILDCWDAIQETEED